MYESYESRRTLKRYDDTMAGFDELLTPKKGDEKKKCEGGMFRFVRPRKALVKLRKFQQHQNLRLVNSS